MLGRKQQISSRTVQSLQMQKDFFSLSRFAACHHFVTLLDLFLLMQVRWFTPGSSPTYCKVKLLSKHLCLLHLWQLQEGFPAAFCSDIIVFGQVVSAPVLTRPTDRIKIWKDRGDEVVAAGKGEITAVEGCGFSIIQSDNMPLSWNHETLPDSLELGRLAGKRIMQDDGICHNLHCPGNIWFDRAMRGRGLVMSHGQVTEEAWQKWFLRYVHQS